MFGPHLILDLYGCNKEKLSDLDFIYKILDELPELIGMHKLSLPSVKLFHGNPDTFDKGGVSGFVVITESHISIHTFFEQQYVSVDIFSCKEFDMKGAEEYVVEKFEAKKVEKHFLIRGTEFSKDVEKEKETISDDRKNEITNEIAKQIVILD